MENQSIPTDKVMTNINIKLGFRALLPNSGQEDGD